MMNTFRFLIAIACTPWNNRGSLDNGC